MSKIQNRIFKYELKITDSQKIDMPIGARLLSAKEQDGKLMVWALVDLRCANKPKEIMIVGTGHPIEFAVGEYSLNFVDTVVMSNGFVWHIFA